MFQVWEKNTPTLIAKTNEIAQILNIGFMYSSLFFQAQYIVYGEQTNASNPVKKSSLWNSLKSKTKYDTPLIMAKIMNMMKGTGCIYQIRTYKFNIVCQGVPSIASFTTNTLY